MPGGSPSVYSAPAGVTVPERSVLAAREGPGSSTGGARNGHMEDSQTWSKGKNNPWGNFESEG